MDIPSFPSIDHPLKPSNRWGNLKSPYPTGAHWTNFVLGEGNQPATPYPYVVRAKEEALVISYPKMYIYFFKFFF